MEGVEEPRPEPEQTTPKPPPKPSVKRHKTKSLKKVRDPEAEMEQAHRLAHLSRAPGKCPLGTCDQMVFPSSLLVHLLHKHSRDPRCTVATAYDNRPLRLSVDPRSLTPGVPQCLAILLYAGADGIRLSEPGRRLISFPNAGLLNDRRPLEYHLPMVLMICKTTFYALLADKELENDLAALNPTTSGLYVIWVVSPITTHRIHYTLTAFDRYYMQSRSVIRKVRNYTHSQNPSEFLPSETDYLLLRESEAMTMLNGRHYLGCRPCLDSQLLMDMGAQSPGIQLELIVHENLKKTAMEERTSSQLFDTYSGPCTNMPRSKYQLFRGANGKLSLGRKPLPADKDRSRDSAQRTGKHEAQCTAKWTNEGGDERIVITGTIAKTRHSKKRKDRNKGGVEKSAKKSHEDAIPAKSNRTFAIKGRGPKSCNALFRDLPVIDPKPSEDSEFLASLRNDSLTGSIDLTPLDPKPSEDSKFLANSRIDPLTGSSDLSLKACKGSSDLDTNDSYKKNSEEGYQVKCLEGLFKGSGLQVPEESDSKNQSGYKNSSEESLPEKYSRRRQVLMKNRSGTVLSSLLKSSAGSKNYSAFPAPVPVPVQFSDPKLMVVPSLLIPHNEETKKNSQQSKKSESSEESLPDKYTRFYQKNLKPRSYPQELKANNQCPSKDEIHTMSNDDMIRIRRPNRSSRQLDDIFLQKEREWESAGLKGAGFHIEPVRSPQSLSQEVIESQNATAMGSAIKPVSCPLAMVREAAMRSVKDSLLMPAKETILLDVDLPSFSSSESENAESEVDIKPETDPAIAEPEEEKPTASDTNLPIITGLVLTLEETSGSDWEQP